MFIASFPILFLTVLHLGVNIYKIEIFKYIKNLNTAMKTETVTISIGKDVMDKLRKLAAKEKQKKGFLGKTITEATRMYIEEKEQEKIRKRALQRLKIGYHMGKILIKHRSELYDRK